jgi:hypothetical protein
MFTAPLVREVTCVLVVALVAGGTACSTSTSTEPGGAPVPSSGSATSPPTVESTSPADAARQQAVAVYLGMWRNYAQAATTSDWQSPKLAEFATGTALSAMSRGLYADHYNGLVSRGEPVNDPVVFSADPADLPTRIQISDCGDSTNWRKFRVDNGQPAEGEPGGRRRINAIVAKQPDGSWKVNDFGVREVGSC